MNTNTLRIYSLDYKNSKTYLFAFAFVVGNILLPQLCHFIPNGGRILLPIYFFTLIAAYKYGWKTGLLTAVFSPALNSALFGMPMVEMLPAILLKSVLLAFAAALAAKHFKRISISILLLVVLSYQTVGTLGEWLLSGSFYLAIQDFRMAAAGMLLQVFGGFAVIKYLIKR